MSLVDKVVAGLLLWTLFSLWWVVRRVSDEEKKDPWYTWFIAPPAMFLAFAVSILFSFIRRKHKKKTK